jgi:[ribosomal protein S5]-alanine N-acetyltransferase
LEIHGKFLGFKFWFLDVFFVDYKCNATIGDWMMISKEFNYPSLETERLYLKVLTLEDTDAVYRHFADANVTEFMDIEPCKDLKEAEEIIQFHMDDLGCRWGIYSKDDHSFIGTGGFHYIREKQNIITAEVGFDLAKNHWGKGFMREVMEALIEFGFKEMNLDSIDATVEQENERSIALMNRLGFIRASELQDNLIYFYINKEHYKK